MPSKTKTKPKNIGKKKQCKPMLGINHEALLYTCVYCTLLYHFMSSVDYENIKNGQKNANKASLSKSKNKILINKKLEASVDSKQKKTNEKKNCATEGYFPCNSFKNTFILIFTNL